MKKDNSNLKKEDLQGSKSTVGGKDKKKVENIKPDKVTGKKKIKNSSALIAASKGRSAVDQVKVRSKGDVSGSGGLTNTGPFVSYENED